MLVDAPLSAFEPLFASLTSHFEKSNTILAQPIPGGIDLHLSSHLKEVGPLAVSVVRGGIWNVNNHYRQLAIITGQVVGENRPVLAFGAYLTGFYQPYPHFDESELAGHLIKALSQPDDHQQSGYMLLNGQFPRLDLWQVTHLRPYEDIEDLAARQYNPKSNGRIAEFLINVARYADEPLPKKLEPAIIAKAS